MSEVRGGENEDKTECRYGNLEEASGESVEAESFDDDAAKAGQGIIGNLRDPVDSLQSTTFAVPRRQK